MIHRPSNSFNLQFQISKKSAEKAKKTFEKEIADLKQKSALNNEFPSKKLQELQDQNKELEDSIAEEIKKNSTLTGQYEILEEEHVLFKAQLTTEKEKLESEIKSLKTKVKDFEDFEVVNKKEKSDLAKKITDLQRKLTEAEHNSSQKSSSSFDLEKSRLKSKLEEKESEFNKLQKQNEMNVDQLSSIRKDVSGLSLGGSSWEFRRFLSV
jgi:chromosome segregation ATPase